MWGECLTYLPGEILLAYAEEIQEKSRLVRKVYRDYYDEGFFFAPHRQTSFREYIWDSTPDYGQFEGLWEW